MGTPVWNLDGILCLANPFKAFVKVTFPKGAQLEDPRKHFNAELGGNAWRAIKYFEGDQVDERALAALVREAIAVNAAKPAKRKASKPAARPAPKRAKAPVSAARKSRAPKSRKP